MRRAVGALDERWAALTIVEIDAGLAHLAGHLAETHALRAYDAVQLATGLLAGRGSHLVTWDQDLAAVARSAGLTTIPV